TIVDAYTTIHRSYVHVLPQLGFPAPTMKQVRRAEGGGLENAMHPFVPEAPLNEAVSRSLEHANTTQMDDVRLTPGTLSLPREQQAAGVTFAVFTNQRGEHARQICSHLGIMAYLKGIFGAGGTAWLKPQPEFAPHVLATFGAKPPETMLVGDSPFDVKA